MSNPEPAICRPVDASGVDRDEASLAERQDHPKHALVGVKLTKTPFAAKGGPVALKPFGWQDVKHVFYATSVCFGGGHVVVVFVELIDGRFACVHGHAYAQEAVAPPDETQVSVWAAGDRKAFLVDLHYALRRHLDDDISRWDPSFRRVMEGRTVLNLA